MSESNVPQSLILDLERRQDEVLRQLDDLNARLVKTLAEWSKDRSQPAEEAPLRKAA